MGENVHVSINDLEKEETRTFVDGRAGLDIGFSTSECWNRRMRAFRPCIPHPTKTESPSIAPEITIVAINIMSDWLGLSGKLAVVTGAASGIGRATARCLAEAGCSVALLDRDAAGVEAAAKELSAKGFKAVGFACDTSDKGSVDAAAAKVRQALGGDPTIVVNNAGILRAGPLESISVQAWNETLNVNLTGYLLVAQAFIPGMKAKGEGAFVHTASIAGSNAQGNSGAYSPSKAAVRIFSQTLALELGKFGM